MRWKLFSAPRPADTTGVTAVRQWEIWRLDLPLRVFLLAQTTVAALLLGGVFVAAAQGAAGRAATQDWALLGLLLAAGLFSQRLVAPSGLARVLVGRGNTGTISVSTQSVWIFAAVVLALPFLVAATALVLSVCDDLRVRWSRPPDNPHPYYRVVFNTAVTTSAALAGAFTYNAFPREGTPGMQLLAAVAAYAALHVVTEMSLVTVFTLAAGRPYRIATEVVWPLSLEDVGLASLGFMMAMCWRADPLLILLGLPTVSLLQQALLHKQLRDAASRDSKTGLLAADRWREEAEGILSSAERDSLPVGVVIVDLDHFKAVNDTYGHLVGDDVLIAVAGAMTGVVREQDRVGRFGGEEFVVLLPGAGAQAAGEIAERIRLAVAALEVRYGGPELVPAPMVRITASAGAAVFPMHGSTLEELLEQADLALYVAKHAGRDRVCFAGGNDILCAVDPPPVDAIPTCCCGNAGCAPQVAPDKETRA